MNIKKIDDFNFDRILESVIEEDNIKQRDLFKFLSGLNKKEIKKYFTRLINTVLSLPSTNRRTLRAILTIFMYFAPLSYYLDDDSISTGNANIIKTVVFDFKKFASFDDALDVIKEIEKGFSIDIYDKGNYLGGEFIGTNYGITANTLKEYLGRTPTKEDMLHLTFEEAKHIYKREYWDKQNLGALENQSLANLIFDGCVNHGRYAMVKILREVYNQNNIPISNEVPFDIEFLTKVNASHDLEKIFNDIKLLRIKSYSGSKTKDIHLTGWYNRMKNFVFEP